MAYFLKERIVEPEEMSVAREQHSKQHVTQCFLCGPRHFPTATGMRRLYLENGTQLCQLRVISLQLAAVRQTHQRSLETVAPARDMRSRGAHIVVSY